MTLEERVAQVKERVATAARAAGREVAEVRVEAATKTQTSETIRAVIRAGISICGENRVQELSAHLNDYAYDGARLHFIGHLQTNKVKQVVGRVDRIESVDSRHLLAAINAQAGKLGIVQDILMEINIGGEEQRHGIRTREAAAFAKEIQNFSNIRLCGLMAVPPVGYFGDENRRFFAEMRHIFVDIRRLLSDNRNNMDCLSMGMSGDYEDAIREGATHVRLGSALFGARIATRPNVEGSNNQ